MGLIPEEDRRPRDWAYKAVFDRKDLPSLQEMARHIRETHDVSIIEDFNLKCERKLAGQAAILDNGLEIKTVTKTEDLVVNVGLQQCINIILGISSTRWSHFGMSSGGASILPAVTQTALFNEDLAHRVLPAWAEPVGMKMFFGAISSQTANTLAPPAIDETGLYNGSTGGAILLNRSLFYPNSPDLVLADVAGTFVAPAVISVVIEFCPVA